MDRVGGGSPSPATAAHWGDIMMRKLVPAVVVVCCAVPSARGYVEAPYSLGQVCNEAANIVLVEVARVNKEKGLVFYKKIKDLKGKHPTEEIKHNIGQRGFHAREWQGIMSWAEPGKKAVFFYHGGASETCIGTYWYQCYAEGEWWGLSHAEPFLLRSYYGEVDKLADALTAMLQGKEVVVTCLADGPKEQLHLRKGKVQQLKASLKRGNYDAKRDFVTFGGDGVDIPEFKSVSILAESAAGWRFVPAAEVQALGDRWRLPDFDDTKWRTGKAPIGYGEPELTNRKGTTIAEKGQPFVFRRAFDVPAEVLNQKGTIIRVAIASDDGATVFLNGEPIDQDDGQHEFSYWNREVELPPAKLKPGRNVLAIMVRNQSASSDLYLDVEVAAQVPVPKPPPKK